MGAIVPTFVETRSVSYRGLKPQKCPKCLGEDAKGFLVHVDQEPVALVQKRVALVQNRVALVQDTLGDHLSSWSKYFWHPSPNHFGQFSVFRPLLSCTVQRDTRNCSCDTLSHGASKMAIWAHLFYSVFAVFRSLGLLIGGGMLPPGACCTSRASTRRIVSCKGRCASSLCPQVPRVPAPTFRRLSDQWLWLCLGRP